MYLHSQVHCTIIGNSQDLEQPKGPSGASQVELVVRACLPVRRCKINSIPGSGRSPGEGHGAPVFLPGESHGQRSLAGYVPTEEPGGL